MCKNNIKKDPFNITPVIGMNNIVEDIIVDIKKLKWSRKLKKKIMPKIDIFIKFS